MLIPSEMEIWLYDKPADMRKSIDTLCIVVAQEMKQSPVNGSLYLFRSRDGKRLKALYYEQNCFTLIYRRLERGKYIFPKDHAGHLKITEEHFKWLLASDKYSRSDAMEIREYSGFY